MPINGVTMRQIRETLRLHFSSWMTLCADSIRGLSTTRPGFTRELVFFGTGLRSRPASSAGV